MKLYVQPLVNYPKTKNEGLMHLITVLQEKFLTLSSSAKILLLEGETGSGKSIACRFLQRFIFLNQSQEFDNWVPIFIDLEYSDEPAYKVIQKILAEELYLMADEIDELRNGELDVLFIIDRCHQDREAILQKMSDLWDSSKVIFTLNKENLIEFDEDKLLFPPMNPQSYQLINNSILRLTLMPFPHQMVIQYVQQFTKYYAPSGESGKMLEDYFKSLGDFNFWEPLSLPLTLSLACKTFPFTEGQDFRQIQSKNLFDVTEKKRQLQMKKISRRAAYEAFLEKWFKEISGLTHKPKEIILSYAAHLVQKVGKTLLTADELKEFKTKKEKLLTYLPTRTYKVFSTAAEVELIHKSFEAYFLSEAMILEITNFQATESSCDFQSQSSNLIFGQRILNVDSLTFNFLIDAIRDEKITAKNLLAIIEYSKTTRLHSRSLSLKEREPIINIEINTDENLSIPHITAQTKESYFGLSATNAINLLNWMNYDFSFLDLSHVQIPGANLSNGNFTGAKFIGANLKGVNFTCACLKDVDFLSANMAGISLGEYTSSELNQNFIGYFSSSSDGRKFAEVCWNKVTVFKRDLACSTLREVFSFRLEGSFDTHAFNSDLKLLVTIRNVSSYCDGFVKKSQIKFWDIDKRTFTETSICGTIIVACQISTDDKYIALRGEDKVIKILDTRSKKVIKTLRGHTESISTFSFSLDSRLLVSGGKKELIVWDLDKSTLVKTKKCAKSILKCIFSPDKKYILTFDDDYVSSIWELDRGLCVKAISRIILKGFKFTSDSKYLVLTSGTSCLIWNAETNEWTENLKSQPCSVLQCALNLEFQTSYQSQLCPNDIFYARNTAISYIREKSGYTKNSSLDLSGAFFGCVGLTTNQVAFLHKKSDRYRVFRKSFLLDTIVISSNTSELRKIELRGAKICDRSAVTIARGFLILNLEELILCHNDIGDYGACELAKNKTWQKLQLLDLRQNKINDAGATGLGANTSWVNLKVLNLADNKIQDKGAIGLGANISWFNLENLYLTNNEIRDEGAVGLGMNTSWANLKAIDLATNQIQDKGAIGLGENTSWINLEIFNLMSNKIGADGAEGLRKNSVWKKLQKPDLFRNGDISFSQLQLSGTGFVGRNTSWTNLTTLWLSQTQLGVQDTNENVGVSSINNINISVLASNTSWTKLKRLSLVGTLIDDTCFLQLINNQTWTILEALDLTDNIIEFVRNDTFATNNWNKLRRLVLTRNKIANKDALMLNRGDNWTELEELCLSRNSMETMALKR